MNRRFCRAAALLGLAALLLCPAGAAGETRLRVASGSQSVPIDYFDDSGTYRGVAADVLAEVSARTGIELEFIRAESLEDACRMVREGEADLATGLIDSAYLPVPEGIALYHSYLETPYVIVSGGGLGMEDIGEAELATVRGQKMAEHLRNEQTVHEFNHLEDALLAVQRGEVDYCYTNVYCAEYYQRVLALDNVSLIPLPDLSFTISFGGSSPADPAFAEILGNAIDSIPQRRREEIVRRNFFEAPEPFLLPAFLRKHLGMVSLALLCAALLLTGAVTCTTLRRRRRQDQQLSWYRTLADLMGETIFEYHFRNDTLTLSGANAAQFGIPTVIHRFLRRLHAHEFDTPGNLRLIERLDRAYRDGISTKPVDFNCVCTDGQEHWFSAVVVLQRDRRERPLSYLGKVRNIDHERVEKDRLIEMALRDTLTGLYNKGATERLCGEALARASSGSLSALIVLDVDNFKNINDTHGHHHGDEILRLVASLLRGTFRAEDVLGRVGGDEFAALVQNLPGEETLRERVRALSASFVGKGVSCSIGVSVCPRDGRTYEKLFRRADEALYQTKKSGKGSFRFYQGSKERLEEAENEDTAQ